MKQGVTIEDVQNVKARFTANQRSKRKVTFVGRVPDSGNAKKRNARKKKVRFEQETQRVTRATARRIARAEADAEAEAQAELKVGAEAEWGNSPLVFYYSDSGSDSPERVIAETASTISTSSRPSNHFPEPIDDRVGPRNETHLQSGGVRLRVDIDTSPTLRSSPTFRPTLLRSIARKGRHTPHSFVRIDNTVDAYLSQERKIDDIRKLRAEAERHRRNAKNSLAQAAEAAREGGGTAAVY